MADETPAAPPVATEQPVQAIIIPTAPVVVTPTPGIDETVPGGIYVVNGEYVNAFGEPVKGKPRR